ncbi:K domain type 1, partial [Trinorchestia longiramus]
DVLNPSTYWVGNRCYRVLTHHIDTASAYNTYVEEDEYADEVADFLGAGEDEEQNHEFSVDKLTNGLYRTAWHVPNVYYAYLIGRRGDTRRRLELETGSKISIPQRGAGVAEEVVVTGPTVPKVRAGRLKVELLVEQARRKQPLTHFVSIPIAAPHTQQRFLQFKEAVLEQCSTSIGVCEELFQHPARLHLTLGVMALVDETERKLAIQIFRDAVEANARDIPDGLLRLHLRGLHYFRDDPHSVKVLYAGLQACDASSWPEGSSPHLPQQLQNFADNVSNSMIKAG